MKFGKVDDPQNIDFTLPPDHPDTVAVLSKNKRNKPLKLYVGCAKWNKSDLKNFYPRGTKDELTYYSRQFNSIELNATFYRIFPAETYNSWYEKTPQDFKFFPKLSNDISHLRRLNDKVYPIVDRYLEVTAGLKEKLGTIFVQLHDNFGPKNWDRVEQFVAYWPKEYDLAMEFRHTEWFNDNQVSERLYHLLESNGIANVLVDTAGRRDIMHMRLTTNEAFIRYVGANHESDYDRLDSWVKRLGVWMDAGLRNIHFFVHQNLEKESPLLSAYFIKKMNDTYGTDLKVPSTPNPPK